MRPDAKRSYTARHRERAKQHQEGKRFPLIQMPASGSQTRAALLDALKVARTGVHPISNHSNDGPPHADAEREAGRGRHPPPNAHLCRMAPAPDTVPRVIV